MPGRQSGGSRGGRGRSKQSGGGANKQLIEEVSQVLAVACFWQGSIRTRAMRAHTTIWVVFARLAFVYRKTCLA